MPLEEPQPVFIPHPGRIIVIGDVHGDIDRLMFILRSIKIISLDLQWIAEPQNTVVVQLGDQIDSISRGGDGEWDQGKLDLNVMLLMENLDEIAIAAGGGGRVLSVIGNHELLNLFHQFVFVSPNSLAMVDINQRKELFMRGNDTGIGKCTSILTNRNVLLKVGPYLFSHAGLLREHLDILEQAGIKDLDYMNQLLRAYMRGHQLTPAEASLFNRVIAGDEGILWNRQYVDLLFEQCDSDKRQVLQENLQNMLFRTQSMCMFIGHNVVEGITTTANNTLFFTDAGLSRSFGRNRMQVIEILSTPHGDAVNVVNIDQ
jgi:hypothetical protein